MRDLRPWALDLRSFLRSNIKGRTSKVGFTFIEMIVAIGVIAFALPTLFAVSLSVLQQQIKVSRLYDVKRQGDHVLNVMGATIRSNAIAVYQDSGLSTALCSSTAAPDNTASNDGTSFYFKDKAGKYFNFYLNSNIIYEGSNDSASYPSGRLTSSSMYVSSFTVQCDRNASYASPIITVQFTICYAASGGGSCATSRPEEIASLTYKTQIKLRNQ